MRWAPDSPFVCTVKEFDPASNEYKGVTYTGSVTGITVKEEREWPNSVWEMLEVRWDSGEQDRLSPWDVRPLVDAATHNVTPRLDAATAQRMVTTVEMAAEAPVYSGELSCQGKMKSLNGNRRSRRLGSELSESQLAVVHSACT